MTCPEIDLADVDTADTFYLVARFDATSIVPTAESTAVTFELASPAGGAPTTVTNGDTKVTGPFVTTLTDGRKRTEWRYLAGPLTVPGIWRLRVRSTAGIIASRQSTFTVRSPAPFT